VRGRSRFRVSSGRGGFPPARSQWRTPAGSAQFLPSPDGSRCVLPGAIIRLARPADDRLHCPAMPPASIMPDWLYIMRCQLSRDRCGRQAPSPQFQDQGNNFLLISVFCQLATPEAPAIPNIARVQVPVTHLHCLGNVIQNWCTFRILLHDQAGEDGANFL
jgi:hypothetical protein